MSSRCDCGGRTVTRSWDLHPRLSDIVALRLCGSGVFIPGTCVPGYRMSSLRDFAVRGFSFMGLASQAIGCRRVATEKLIIRKYKIGSNSILDWHSNYAEAEIVVEPGFCRLFNI